MTRFRVFLAVLVALLALAPAARAQVVPTTEIRFTQALPSLLGITVGTGSPEGVLARCVGSIYLRRDGTSGATVYFKETGSCGSTGWTTGALGGGGGGSHSLLSATHTDTVANAAVRGALIVGDSTPSWARFAIGSSGTMLRSNGVDPSWSTDGSGLTSLNATSLTSGTVPDARLSSNVSLFGTAVDNAEITAGTITFAKWASNSCATDDIPKWNGAAWACAVDEDTGGGGGADPAASYITKVAEGALSNEFALGTLATGLLKNTTTTGVPTIAAAGTDYVAPGAITTSGLTMATARLLGRSTASTGAVEEITVGTGLTLSAGTLTAGAGSGDVVGPGSATDNALARFDSTTGKLIQNGVITEDDNGVLTLPDGQRQTFNPDGTTPGLNVGSQAGDPSTPSNGDLWYDSTANELTARIGGSNVALGAGATVVRAFGITIDGGGTTITTGVKGFVTVPFSGTITRATLLSTDGSVTSCSIVIDVWKDTYANYPPVDADSITASAPPTLSSATKSDDSTLTGWSTSVTAGDIFGFNVDSVTGCTRVLLTLRAQ